MCGIAGILNLNRDIVSPAIIKKMTDILAHRGPDSEGIYIDRFVGLGHRRLSIIDLSSAGNQPMITKDRRYAITFNGEIYNYKEIRTQLESVGFRFKSNTDTEVVLNAYVQWGEASVLKLNGMFAFAIWDKEKEKLFLARDRYGIKPFYYYLRNNMFVFGSEQKAILEVPEIKKELDLEAVYEYFTFQNIFTDKTFFKDIKIIPPASYGFLDLKRNKQPKLILQQYWDYNFFETNNNLSELDAKEELNRLFYQAVNRQLMSDVDIGSYLSGGMDSGSITAIASKQINNLRTFTCGFDLHSASGLEIGFDEREKAEFMSYLFKTEQYEMVLKSGDMERCLPELAWHIEEPRVGQCYPNFYIAKLASKFVKVVLSGCGGDEMFAGYPWRYYRAMRNDNFDKYIDSYYNFWQRLIPSTIVKDVFSPIWQNVQHISTKDIFRNVFSKINVKIEEKEDYINYSLYFEAKTFLHGLLIIEDKLSMAHGLETRVPFLDNDLVDFALNIPVKLKLRNIDKIIKLDENEVSKYFNNNNDGKLIIRKVMEQYIPVEIHDAIKQGFSAPDASWFKGESIDYVRKVIFDRRSRIYDYLDHSSVQDLVNEHLEGKLNHRLAIWSFINFEWFLRKYLP